MSFSSLVVQLLYIAAVLYASHARPSGPTGSLFGISNIAVAVYAGPHSTRATLAIFCSGKM